MKCEFIFSIRTKWDSELYDRFSASGVKTVTLTTKNAKQTALKIDSDGLYGAFPGYGVTVKYPSGRLITYRAE